MRNTKTICLKQLYGSVFVEKLTAADVVMEADGRDILSSCGKLLRIHAFWVVKLYCWVCGSRRFEGT
jgi:hypothetical protein